MIACDKIEKGGFPGPVGSYETEDFTLPDLETHPGNGGEAPEGFRQIVYFEQSHIKQFSRCNIRVSGFAIQARDTRRPG